MCRVDGLAVCLRGGNRRVPACTSNLQKSKNSHCLAKAALGGSSDGRSGGRRPKKARLPGVFEVEDISPPRRSLGIHAFHPLTHNGDQIEVDGRTYVVEAVVHLSKLVRGRYQRDHSRLEVQSTSRFLLNEFLKVCMDGDV